MAANMKKYILLINEINCNLFILFQNSSKICIHLQTHLIRAEARQAVSKINTTEGCKRIGIQTDPNIYQNNYTYVVVDICNTDKK